MILTGINKLFSIPEETFVILNRLRWLVGAVIMTSVLMLVYMIAPNRKLSFRQVIYGALLATISWQIISFSFSLYIENFNSFTATYGSLGGVIVLMLWFYLSGLILIIGGEINATLYNLERKSA